MDFISYYDLDSFEVSANDFSEEENAFLNEMNCSIVAASSLDEVMNLVFSEGSNIFPCDRLSLVLIKDAGRRFTTLWSKATYSPVFLDKGFVADIDKTSLGELLSNRKARVIHDLEQYQHEYPTSATTQMLLDEGIKSSFAFPLRVDDKGVGFVLRSSKQPHVYNEHFVNLQRAIAERLSLAVEKAYHLQQLTETNKAYMEMLSFVAHELKSPLSSVILDAQMIRDGHLGELNEDQERKLGSIINRSSYLMDLVKDYLDLAKIEQGRFNLQVTDDISFATDLVRPCVDMVFPQARKKQINVNIDLPKGDFKASCDPELLRIAILNLLDNSIKYGRDHGNVVVTAQKTPKGFVLSIWNEGPGFPEGEKDQLFKKFSRLKTKELFSRKGTGLGLYTTWRIVNQHGGSIEARSEVGLWAEFTIRIPQPIK